MCDGMCAAGQLLREAGRNLPSKMSPLLAEAEPISESGGTDEKHN